MLKVVGISTEEFLLAAKVGNVSTQETARDRINRMIQKNINNTFAEFYQTEQIALKASFNAGNVTFMVQSSDGESLMLSERSNGLRWYLETYIDTKANELADRNIMFLFDEPGIALHVNAQREILELFEHLAQKGNQLVYSTHSPYMLNLEREGIHKIRAIVKDEKGYTQIYKTAYDSRIASDVQMDTLTPIITALGMNLYNTFGPAELKINIVTEGISDYIYLCTMARVLELDMEKYAILPSVGATNCVHICSILHGWGCKYIALFDYDKEGVEKGGEYLRKELLWEMGKQYDYVKEVSQDEIDRKNYINEKVIIEDVISYSEIERFCQKCQFSNTLGKALTAKLMCEAIENGSFVLKEESINNFKELFGRLTKNFD